MTERKDNDALVVGLLALLFLIRKPKAAAASTADALRDQWLPDRPIELHNFPEGNVMLESASDDSVAWVWPVPSLVDPSGKIWPAVVSSPFGNDRKDHLHAGQDIMYERANNHTVPRREPGDHGSKNFFAPAGTPVVAARAGRIWSTSHGSKGWQVIIDHGAPWSTMYLHMDELTIPAHKSGKLLDTGEPGQLVEAGDVLGRMGWSPVDSQQVRHLHFEVRKNSTAGKPIAVDATKLKQKSWGRKTWRI